MVSAKYGAHSIVHINDSSCFFSSNFGIQSDGIYKKERIFIAKRPLQEINCLEYLDIKEYIKSEEANIEDYSMKPHRGTRYVNGPDIVTVPPEGKFLNIYSTLTCMEESYLQGIISDEPMHYCLGDTINYNAKTSLYADSYMWFDNNINIGNTNSVSFTAFDKGQHVLTLIVSDGCFYDTSFVHFNIYGSDTIRTSKTICDGDTITIQDQEITSNGLYTFTYENIWGCDSLNIIDISFEEPQEFEKDTSLCKGQVFVIGDISTSTDTIINLYYLSAIGCDSIIQINIQFDQDCDQCQLQLPLAFTPNGDGLNDAFGIINPCDQLLLNFSMRIYSRWGQLVYSTKDPKANWDGKFKEKEGISEVYLVIINTQLPDETAVQLRGDFTLIR